MNTLTRWDPFKDVEELQNRLSSIFGQSPTRRSGTESEVLPVAKWAPVVDVAESDHEYVIQAELPAVNREDVKVSVEDGVLTLSGERKFEKEEKNKKYHRIERAYGSFIRTFSIPSDVDPDKVRAEFKEGVLTVRLEKDERSKPRSVEVKVS